MTMLPQSSPMTRTVEMQLLAYLYPVAHAKESRLYAGLPRSDPSMRAQKHAVPDKGTWIAA